MNRKGNSLDKALRRHLGLFGGPSSSQVEGSRQRILQALSSESRLERINHSVPARKGWRWGLAAAAAVALGALAVLLGSNAFDKPQILATVELSDNALAPGSTVEAGRAIRSSDKGSVIAMVDGSRVELRAQSELSLERVHDGIRIRLNKGGVIVNAAKQGSGHLYVQTKDITVAVVGTVFLVNAEEQGSRVAVIEGEVLVEGKRLRPGQQVATNPVMASVPVIEEIAWSRNAAAHQALLQMSLALMQQPVVAPAPPPDTFEVASIRRTTAAPVGGGRGASVMPSGCALSPPQIDPKRFAVTGTTLHTIIVWAYGTGGITIAGCRYYSALNIISGGPGWTMSDQWDIQAIIPDGAPSYTREQLNKGDAPKLRKMLQALIEDRFKVVVRREIKEVEGYALTAEKGAPRNTVRTEIDTPQFREMRAKQAPGIIVERGAILVTQASIAELVPVIEQDVGRPVLDRTGLSGQYSFVIEYTPLFRLQSGGTPFFGPAIFTALPEQTGLKLEAIKTSMEVLVVERAEKPSEN